MSTKKHLWVLINSSKSNLWKEYYTDPVSATSWLPQVISAILQDDLQIIFRYFPKLSQESQETHCRFKSVSPSICSLLLFPCFFLPWLLCPLLMDSGGFPAFWFVFLWDLLIVLSITKAWIYTASLGKKTKNVFLSFFFISSYS